MRSGEFADVWKGKHKGQVVAAKSLRVYGSNFIAGITQQFFKELVLWKTLHHPNLLPLLGVMISEDPHLFVTVWEWIENGNIHEFLKTHPNANRQKLVRFSFRILILTQP